MQERRALYKSISDKFEGDLASISCKLLSRSRFSSYGFEILPKNASGKYFRKMLPPNITNQHPRNRNQGKA
jgi:hypothetical protein